MKNNPLVWMVKEYDFNASKIVDENILKYSLELIKKLKKKSKDKVEFSEFLDREMMWRYWSKCEHELIISVDDNQCVYLKPFIGNEQVYLNVTSDKSFDWLNFANLHIKRQIFLSEAKIDVYDQLKYRWEEFVDYCWNTHLPYERKRKPSIETGR